VAALVGNPETVAVFFTEGFTNAGEKKLSSVGVAHLSRFLV
jgi:hypothetical protein